jgi:ribosomal protein S18 acetylase RimI-like enzyme
MLYVHPAAQGRGYGRALLREGMDDLGRRGLLPAVVWVLHENPARDFYRRMGATYVMSQTIDLGAPLVEDAYQWASWPTHG